MGDGDTLRTTRSTCQLPVSALSAECKFRDIVLRIKNTPNGGDLQGIIEPLWNKTMESEQRLAWLGEMIDKKLVVRDIWNFEKTVTNKLRAESSKEEEIGSRASQKTLFVKSQGAHDVFP